MVAQSDNAATLSYETCNVEVDKQVFWTRYTNYTLIHNQELHHQRLHHKIFSYLNQTT